MSNTKEREKERKKNQTQKKGGDGGRGSKKQLKHERRGNLVI